MIQHLIRILPDNFLWIQNSLRDYVPSLVWERLGILRAGKRDVWNTPLTAVTKTRPQMENGWTNENKIQHFHCDRWKDLASDGLYFLKRMDTGQRCCGQLQVVLPATHSKHIGC